MGHIYTGTAPNMSSLTPAQLAKELGTYSKKVLDWYHAGKIPAEIAEERTYRFDLAKVRKALADRAAKPTP